MAIPVEFDPARYAALVASGAAVDPWDAHDLVTTEELIAKQPHRKSELRKALSDRRAPRMRRARGIG